MDIFKRFLPYLRPYMGAIIFSGICLLIATPCQLFHPLVWKFIVDDVITDGKYEMLAPALGVMVIVHLIGYGLNAVRNYVLGKVGQNFIYDLRNRVYDKLQRQSMGYFHSRRSGDLISRAMSDVDAVEQVVIHGIDNVIGNALSFFYVSVIIVSIQPMVGTATLVPIAIVAVLIYKFNRRIKKLYRSVRETLGDVTSKLQENLQGMMTIKAFARESYEQQRFQAENDVYRRRGIEAVRARSVYYPAVFSVGFLSNVIMVGLGAVFVINGKMTIGGLVAYRGYWWQLFSPIQSIATINEMLQRAAAAGSRIFELLDEPEEIEDAADAMELQQVKGSIEFEQVNFAYDEKGHTLREIDLRVEPGQSIGIVGPSGSGKSTLLHLILRFHDPGQGKILLDGRDLRSLSQQSLRSHIGIVTQEAFLFHDTVRNNLRYGKLDATESEVEAAAIQANAHEFISQLNDGYDTQIGERGVKLSGGQRQRLCIARAFLANPEILLLDEATAAVEPESELLIQGALQRLMKGRTTIVVSHRLSMVRDADAILVIQDGRLVERGSHEQLMARGAWYARMYRMQMEGAPAGDTV